MKKTNSGKPTTFWKAGILAKRFDQLLSKGTTRLLRYKRQPNILWLNLLFCIYNLSIEKKISR